MPAWCFLAFSEVEDGAGLRHPRPSAEEHTHDPMERSASMVKETSVRAQRNHYRLSPMTPEKRAYLDREAYMDQITRPDRFPQQVLRLVTIPPLRIP